MKSSAYRWFRVQCVHTNFVFVLDPDEHSKNTLPNKNLLQMKTMKKRTHKHTQFGWVNYVNRCIPINTLESNYCRTNVFAHHKTPERTENSYLQSHIHKHLQWCTRTPIFALNRNSRFSFWDDFHISFWVERKRKRHGKNHSRKWFKHIQLDEKSTTMDKSSRKTHTYR